MLSYNLFWNNSIAYLNSNVDEELTIIGDPFIGSDYILAYNSPAIDAGVAQFSSNGVVILDLSASQYLGAMPDLGAIEKK